MTGLSLARSRMATLWPRGTLLDQVDCPGRLAFEGDHADLASLFQVFDGDADVVIEFVQQNAMFHISIESYSLLCVMRGWKSF